MQGSSQTVSIGLTSTIKLRRQLNPVQYQKEPMIPHQLPDCPWEAGVDLGFLKGGLTQGTIISWMEVCKAHLPVKHAEIRGSGSMPPQEIFEK